MKKGLLVFSSVLLSAFLLLGCAQGYAAFLDAADVEIPLSQPMRALEPPESLELAAAAGLIGCEEWDAIALLGKGEDLFADDGFEYIGRRYTTQLYQEPVTAYTNRGNDNRIDSLTLWLTDGKSPVTADVVARWQERITAAAGAEMQVQPVSAASGMQSWKWQTADRVFTLRLLDDVLTLGINAAIGELK